MRVVIIGVLAFLLSLGGGTGFVMWKAGHTPAAVASADSTAAKQDSVTHRESADSNKNVAVVPPSDSTATVTPKTDSSAGSSKPASADSARKSTTNPSEKADSPESSATVARILAAMKPKDAQAILAHLDDDQIEGLLRSLPVRQSAAMLSLLESQRAATMSRRLLIPSKGRS
jgi:flagellar motility protein MotE (MotC chaperone)